jgi:enoyl-CoA hydratase
MLNPSSYQSIRFLRAGRVLTICLNRPEHLNAVDETLHAELARVFIEAEDDPDSDVLVLTGAGKAFCAGGDVGWMQKTIDDPESFSNRVRREGKRIIYSMLEVEKPLIAKVNGAAVGLGATLALFCDVIFASDKARIGDPHVCVGYSAGDGSAVIWPQLIGHARAKEYLMTGDLIPAPRAAEMGLINHAVPPEQLDGAVDAFCARLLGGALTAIRYSKLSVNLGLKQLAHSILDASLAFECLTNIHPDHQAAVHAFKARSQNETGASKK